VEAQLPHKDSETGPSVGENLMNRLVDLKMQGTDLHEYVDSFNTLIELCAWPKDAADTIWHFKKG
jgi:hypothetical protein